MMNAVAPLQADPEQIGRFVRALFRYAEERSFVSLRAFRDDANAVFAIQPLQLSADLDALVAAATTLATRAAQAANPVVFAPPIATFLSREGATEADLQNGLALSVECDTAPQGARQKLEQILGPATIVVASGGEWPNPDTGELDPKLHLHWRLTEPTRDAEAHRRLKRCRAMAKDLVGGDATSNPMVHPMRWPGSWHRKNTPRLACIVSATEHELDLDDAFQRLHDTWQVLSASRPQTSAPNLEGRGTGEPRDTETLVAAILSGSDYHAPITALAMRYLKGGMTDAQAVLTLRGMMEAVPSAARDIKDGTHQDGRWQNRYDDIPRAVRTARAEIDAEAMQAAQYDIFNEEAIGRFRLDAMTTGEPPRQEFLLSSIIPLGKVGVIFGAGGLGKSLAALSLCLLVAIRDRFSKPVAGGLSVLGGRVPPEAAGASVFLTLEDDTAEIHRRIAVLDPQNHRRDAPCYIYPAVDFLDFDPALVVPDGRAAVLTALAKRGLDHLLKSVAAHSGRKVRVLVLDPAGDFLNGDENDASFVKLLMRQLRAIARRHGCTIILVGHVAKGIDVDSPTMRGSGAWIANSRFAYALWAPPPAEAEKTAKIVGEPAHSLVFGKLTKANHAGAPTGARQIFVRDQTTGRLIDVSHRESSASVSDEQLLNLLVTACADSAAAGMPYSYSGIAGLWNQRADLPEPLMALPKRRLEALGTLALEKGLLVKVRNTHSQGAPKYLDVPSGPLAMGKNIEMFQDSRAEAIERYRSRKA